MSHIFDSYRVNAELNEGPLSAISGRSQAIANGQKWAAMLLFSSTILSMDTVVGLDSALEITNVVETMNRHVQESKTLIISK